MFAYCLNNPVILSDSGGNVSQVCINNSTDPMDMPWQDAGGGGGKVSSYTSPNYGSIEDKFLTVLLYKYIFNSDEQVVLDAEAFAFYKGCAVIKVPIGENAFSFGLIIMGSDVKDADTVRHEYGHFIHTSQVGLTSYLYTAAVPSLMGFFLVPYESYYSLPWEYVADYLGGVNRDNGNYAYADWSRNAAGWYWLATLVVGGLIS